MQAKESLDLKKQIWGEIEFFNEIEKAYYQLDVE